MDSFIEEVILSNDDIKRICEDLGEKITNDYKNKTPILVGLLKGSVPFFAEIIKHIKCDIIIDFMDVSSYCGVISTGSITIRSDLKEDIKNKDVIIVEDIIDTGLTLQEVVNVLESRGAKSVEICALLDKPAGRTHECKQAKYLGKVIEPKFVVGFGLDYNELYRNLDYVGVLKKSVYMK